MWADSMTTGQQLFMEVICEDPKYCPGAAFKNGTWAKTATASFCDQEELRHFIWLKRVNMVVINSVMEH